MPPGSEEADVQAAAASADERIIELLDGADVER